MEAKKVDPIKVSKARERSEYRHKKELTARRISFEKRLDAQPKPPIKYWGEPSLLILEPHSSWNRKYVGKGEVPKGDQKDYSKWLYSNILQKDWNKLRKLETTYNVLDKDYIRDNKRVDALMKAQKWKQSNILIAKMGKYSIRKSHIKEGYSDSIVKPVGEQRLFMEMEKRGILDVGGTYGWKPPRDSTDKAIKWASKVV